MTEGHDREMIVVPHCFNLYFIVLLKKW